VNEKKDKQDLKSQVIPEKDVIEYVLKRFNEVERTRKIKNLVNFQARNRYMIMAHDQEELKKMGNIVASYKKVPLSEILEGYEKCLRKALEKEPTTKMHTNVIMHIFGYFSKKFSQQEKETFFHLLENFREEKITIGKILEEINPIVFRFNNTYLASQTYFLLYSNVNPGILLSLK
jgi:uncharacterized protein YbgA (DUF1722 family)